MKYLALTFLIVLLISTSADGQEPCKRHLETDGAFSYCPPPGWIADLTTGLKYAPFNAPPTAPLRANINVLEDVSNVPLRNYVDFWVKQAAKPGTPNYLADFKQIRRTNFVTSSKNRGIRVVAEHSYRGRTIGTISYILDAKRGRKLIFTCSALDTDTLTPVLCDDMMKTFRLES